MHIEIRTVEGCPHRELADARVADAVAQVGAPDVTVDHVEVRSIAQVEELAFRGSPTILIEGTDPFGSGGEPVAMTCRMYRTDAGLEGAPSVAQIASAITSQLSR